MSDERDWSKATDEELEDGVMDGDEGAWIEEHNRLCLEIHDTKGERDAARAERDAIDGDRKLAMKLLADARSERDAAVGATLERCAKLCHERAEGTESPLRAATWYDARDAIRALAPPAPGIPTCARCGNSKQVPWEHHPEHGFTTSKPCPACTPGVPVGPTAPLTFERFSEINRYRCESNSAFGESLQPHSKYTLAHWALSICSEAGEVCDAILGWEGLKERRADKTKYNIAEELADVVTYCDLAVSKLGYNLADVIAKKFDEVTDRAGFPDRFKLAPRTPLGGTTQPRGPCSKDQRCVRPVAHIGECVGFPRPGETVDADGFVTLTPPAPPTPEACARSATAPEFCIVHHSYNCAP